jgi:hypothetical protein
MKANRFYLALGLVAAFSLSAIPNFAQTAIQHSSTPIAASAATAVPSLVPYSGEAIASDGKPLGNGQGAEIGVTFQIYRDEQGGEPLWVETQTVASMPRNTRRKASQEPFICF